MMNNMTNIESLRYNYSTNPYYSPYKWFNLAIVLGLESKVKWFLPLFKPNPYNNGYSYQPVTAPTENHYDYLKIGDDMENQVKQ
jgi:hypothetical protein